MHLIVELRDQIEMPDDAAARLLMDPADEGEVVLVTSVTEVDCKGMLALALRSN